MIYATVYNQYENHDTGKVEWRKTPLSGTRRGGKPAVHWEANKAVNVIQSGLTSADAVTVMIWFSVEAAGKIYLPPAEYAVLSPAEVDLYWTLAQGKDRLLKGEGPEVPDASAMTAITRRDDCITITSVDTMDYGAPHMRHWGVSGK